MHPPPDPRVTGLSPSENDEPTSRRQCSDLLETAMKMANIGIEPDRQQSDFETTMNDITTTASTGI
jgi:hypothetical protein